MTRICHQCGQPITGSHLTTVLLWTYGEGRIGSKVIHYHDECLRQCSRTEGAEVRQEGTNR